MLSLKLCIIFGLKLTLIINFNKSESITDSECFRAAVYEEIPVGNYSVDNPLDIINLNLNVYERITTEASELGAQIIVFPECGIINPSLPRSHVSKYTEEIPEPQNGKVHNPCEQSREYKNRITLYRLSCMAKNNNIYIVADMGDSVKCSNKTDSNCPDDGHYLFNTAVAFDSEGYLVAKYHKMQLYYEFYYNIPPKQELIYFDTPFGRMGLHICFDMIYRLPGTELVSKHNVTTMIFPTWWFDELPFLSSADFQQAWAITNKVNLLAANIHLPQYGSLGSGIYSGERGAVIYTNTPDQNSRLLIANIPIDSRNKSITCLSDPENIALKHEKHKTVYEHKNMNMEGIKQIKLNKQNDSFNECNNGFCCQISYSVQSKQTLETETYYFIIANRNATMSADYPICEEICGVVRCDSDKDNVCRKFPTKTDETIFENIEISAKFSTNYCYPIITSNYLELVPTKLWKFENNWQIGSDVRLEVNGVQKPIITAGLYGRCFDRDPPYKQFPDSTGTSRADQNDLKVLVMIYFIILILLL